MSSFRSGALWVTVVVLVAVVDGVAARTKPEDRKLAVAARTAVVERVADLIAAKYFDREKAIAVSERLRADLAAGAFDEADTALSLAAALSAVLRPFDGHFGVVWSSDGERFDHHRADWPSIARRSNFGFERAEVLAGNVGFLSMRSFEHPKIAGDTAEAAMAFLANCDALILDLRNNGGGEPEAVQLMLSYLLGPEPVQVGTIYWRPKDLAQQYWTLPHLAGKRLLEQPVFVLAGAGTGSAAEAFILQLKRHERATIVGQRTYGAGNPGDVFSAGHGFNVFIAYGGPPDPAESFDGVGIEPNIYTERGDELSRALLLAYDVLLQTTKDPPQLAVLDWAWDRLRAETTPASLTEADKRSAAGNFGDRRIVYRGGVLVYERGRRAPEVLIPAGGDVFYPTGLRNTKIELVRNASGAVITLKMIWDDGHTETFPRQ